MTVFLQFYMYLLLLNAQSCWFCLGFVSHAHIYFTFYGFIFFSLSLHRLHFALNGTVRDFIVFFYDDDDEFRLCF